MIDKFMSMNKKFEELGKFKETDNSNLFKLIASNNSVTLSLISKLGIFEGSDAAWEDSGLIIYQGINVIVLFVYIA